MKLVKLGKIGKIITGCTPSTEKSEYYVDNKYMFVGPSDIKKVMYVVSSEKNISEQAYKDYKNRFIEKNSIVVDCIGSDMGNVAIVKSKCLTNQQINAITNIDEKKYNIKYIYYVLSTMKKFFHLIGTNGSTMPILNKTMFENIEIEIPKIEIQNKIAKILSKLDDKIKLNNEINNNLYEEAVALYKDKFKGINQDKKTIGDYIVPKRGKNLLTRDAIDGDTPIVAGGIEPSAYHNQFNTKSPVITISASGANAGYINLWSIPVWASDCSYIDDSITKNVYFWYIVLKTRQDEIFDAQTGSAQPHIYPQHIAEMSICELNINEVEKYNNLVAPLFKMIGENQRENKKLSQLRDALLPKLMNGEIDLDNIEI